MNNRFRKIWFLSLALAIGMAVCMSPIGAEAATNDHSKHHSCLTESKVRLENDIRKLWIEHVVWTRSYMVSAVAGLEDQEKVLARLLKNQQDIGNAIKPYYGEEAGKKLADLLTEHIVIAGQVIDAVKNGKQADVEKYHKKWYSNADDIAKYLSSLNPNWAENDLKQLLYMHLQLLTEDLMARVTKNWDGDIAAFDKGIAHIIVLADALSAGIIKQFPGKFK